MAKRPTRKQQHAALLRRAHKDYDVLLERYGNRCGICKRPPGPKRRLDVDHDHRTMKIRGLLCHRCNRGLAWFSDDPVRLIQAASYLGEVARVRSRPA